MKINNIQIIVNKMIKFKFIQVINKFKCKNGKKEIFLICVKLQKIKVKMKY